MFFHIYIFFHDFVNVGFINYSQIEYLLGEKNWGCGSGIVIIFHLFLCIYIYKIEAVVTLFWRTPGLSTLQYLLSKQK